MLCGGKVHSQIGHCLRHTKFRTTCGFKKVYVAKQ